MNNSAGFERLIDARHATDSSLVLRYLAGSGMDLNEVERQLFRSWLIKAGLLEGARIFPLFNYRGVTVHLLDETTRMFTHTFKSIEGCVTSAHCKLRGYHKVVLESGGNAGTAITSYARRLGIETFCFLPQANLPLLNGETFAHPTSHLIAVEARDMVKEAARRFANQHELPLVPRVEWRYDSAMFRGFFILEQLIHGYRFDWIAQSISAAFGPIGIYRVLLRYRQEITPPPRFLGVQQSANCPMYRAWMMSRGEKHLPADNDPLLVSAMYDVRPQTHGTYKELEHILSETGGCLTTVDAKEFGSFLQRRFDGNTVLEWLAVNGIAITVRHGEVVEKAGLTALAGLVKEIDKGKILSGSHVLCSLTGGVTNGDGGAKPEYTISAIEQVDELYK